MTATQYVRCVFQPECLAAEMSVKNFMNMVLDLLDEDLQPGEISDEEGSQED